jgi:hypothetical protein
MLQLVQPFEQQPDAECFTRPAAKVRGVLLHGFVARECNRFTERHPMRRFVFRARGLQHEDGPARRAMPAAALLQDWVVHFMHRFTIVALFHTVAALHALQGRPIRARRRASP